MCPQLVKDVADAVPVNVMHQLEYQCSSCVLCVPQVMSIAKHLQ